MGYIYRYTDLDDNIIKYVGIVWSDNRSLLQRIDEHFTYDKWCYERQWKIEYLEIDNKTDCEGLEGHFISLYNTFNWYNRRKSNWGISTIYSQIDFEWKELSYIPKDFKIKKRNHSRLAKTDALHTEEEIKAVIDYFQKEISKCCSLKRETTARRNLTMFICAINLGLQSSDFCKLTWDVFYDEKWEWRKDMDFIQEQTHHIKKVGKKKIFIWNTEVKVILETWLQWVQLSEKILLNDYIFFTPNNRHIDVNTWEQIMGKAAKAVGINRIIGTRGLRKTMGNRYYKAAKDKTAALVELNEYFGHTNLRATMIYIGLEQEKI